MSDSYKSLMAAASLSFAMSCPMVDERVFRAKKPKPSGKPNNKRAKVKAARKANRKNKK